MTTIWKNGSESRCGNRAIGPSSVWIKRRRVNMGGESLGLAASRRKRDERVVVLYCVRVHVDVEAAIS